MNIALTFVNPDLTRIAKSLISWGISCNKIAKVAINPKPKLVHSIQMMGVAVAPSGLTSTSRWLPVSAIQS